MKSKIARKMLQEMPEEIKLFSEAFAKAALEIKDSPKSQNADSLSSEKKKSE